MQVKGIIKILGSLIALFSLCLVPPLLIAIAGPPVLKLRNFIVEANQPGGALDMSGAQQQQQQYAAPQQPAAQSPEARLQKLKSLKDQGLISESDYNTQKAAIVSSL